MVGGGDSGWGGTVGGQWVSREGTVGGWGGTVGGWGGNSGWVGREQWVSG